MAIEADRRTPGRTELVWAGKRTQVDCVALPFQKVETVNAPRGSFLHVPYRRRPTLPDAA